MALTQTGHNEHEEIFDILLENARWLESKGIYQWPLDWLLSKQDEIIHSVKSGLFFKLVIDNKIAGIVEITPLPDDNWNKDKSSALYIHKLAIRRQYANQFLGQKILDLIAELALKQNIHHLRLDCVSNNVQLKNYYQSYGFSFIRETQSNAINLSLFQYDINTLPHSK